MASNRRPEIGTNYSTLRTNILSIRAKLEYNKEVMNGLQRKFKEAGWIAENSKRFIFVDLTTTLFTRLKKDTSQYEVLGRMLAELGHKDILPSIDENEGNTTRKSGLVPATPQIKQEKEAACKPTPAEKSQREVREASKQTQAVQDVTEELTPKSLLENKKKELDKRRDSAFGEEQIRPPNLEKNAELEQVTESSPTFHSAVSTRSNSIGDCYGTDSSQFEVCPEQPTSQECMPTEMVNNSIQPKTYTTQEYEAMIMDLKRRLHIEKQEKEILRKENEDLRNKLDELSKYVNEVQVPGLKSECDGYKQKLTETDSKNALERQELVDKIAQLEKTIYEKETKILNLKLDLKDSDGRNKDKQNEILVLENKIDKLQHERELAEAREENRRLKQSQQPRELQ